MKATKLALVLALASGSVQAAPEFSLDMLSRTFHMDSLERDGDSYTGVPNFPGDPTFSGGSSKEYYDHYTAQAFHFFGKAKLNPYITLESNAYLVQKLRSDVDKANDGTDRDDTFYVLRETDKSFGKISGAIEITPFSNAKIRYGRMPLDLELLNSGDIKTAPILFSATSLQYSTGLFSFDITEATKSSAPNEKSSASFGKIESESVVKKAPIYVAQANFNNGELSGLVSYARQKGIKYYRMAEIEYQTRLSNDLTVEGGVQYRERKEIENDGKVKDNNHYALRVGASYGPYRTGLAFSNSNDKADIEMSTRWRNQQGQACQSCGFYVAGYNDNSLFHHAGERAIKWNIGADLDQWVSGLSIDGYLIYGDNLHSPQKEELNLVKLDHRQREFGFKVTKQFGANGAEISLQHSRNKQRRSHVQVDPDPDFGNVIDYDYERTSYQTRITLNYPLSIL